MEAAPDSSAAAVPASAASEPAAALPASAGSEPKVLGLGYKLAKDSTRSTCSTRMPTETVSEAQSDSDSGDSMTTGVDAKWVKGVSISDAFSCRDLAQAGLTNQARKCIANNFPFNPLCIHNRCFFQKKLFQARMSTRSGPQKKEAGTLQSV